MNSSAKPTFRTALLVLTLGLTACGKASWEDTADAPATPVESGTRALAGAKESMTRFGESTQNAADSAAGVFEVIGSTASAGVSLAADALTSVGSKALDAKKELLRPPQPGDELQPDERPITQPYRN